MAHVEEPLWVSSPSATCRRLWMPTLGSLTELDPLEGDHRACSSCYMLETLLLMLHLEENKVDSSGSRPALCTRITGFTTSHSAAEGQRITLSHRLGTYSLAALRHRLCFERKDPSPFLTNLTWVFVAQGSPGIFHKDLCVSSGAV